jgi:hypothetical protein
MPSSKSLRVFLCHSSGDKAAVRQLYQRLKSDGFDPWLDEENLLPGQEWNLEITKAVRSSDVVIVCLSCGSVSKTGYFQKETKFALDVAEQQPEGTIFIIPAKLEECEVPERLRRWHWVSLSEKNGYERLNKSLRRRASDLRATTSSTSVDTDETSDSENDEEYDFYDEDTSVEADTHLIYPCDLKDGDKIKIDLRSEDDLDVMIMDADDYQEWIDQGEVGSLYREFLKRGHLHAFFKAREDGQYLIIVRNESDEEIPLQLKISYDD